MGFGDDWKGALEKVKNTFVEPGRQPDLVRDLARQAEASSTSMTGSRSRRSRGRTGAWRCSPPSASACPPFFLGGETIQVSYPTADMSDEEKLMSLRGNNPHFSHATVFHELNPGHHLQGFMAARYNSHRRLFQTPFWSEGQGLYWEMFLWDHGFQASPRIVSAPVLAHAPQCTHHFFPELPFGQDDARPAIQFLVDTVGFERANAEGEVRRSFSGAYSPLYQVAYMIGGLELRSLHAELVDSHRMTEREFHDAVFREDRLPIAMVRARLAKITLTRDGPAPWRFADHLPAPRPAP